MSFIEELLKTKSLMRVMKDKVVKGDSDVDIVEYALATRTLENKLKILKALNIHVESEDSNKIILNVNGSSKALQIDLEKLRDAITILDSHVEEKQASPEDVKPLVDNIPLDGITEEEYLKLAVEKIGAVQKTPQKTLTKECFIKIFKYTGDFAKLKSKDAKAKAQETRCKEFGGDPKKYLEALKGTIAEEEKAYERSSMEMFDKLCITPEFFERS
jgi:vacuolar-type H+-ATPase subunit I/STV1